MILPLVPLRDVVIFPGVVTPLFVGRDKSINALQKAMSDDKSVMLVAQKDPNKEDPSLKDLYSIGTVSTILQLIKLPDGTYKVLVEGIKRASIISSKNKKEYTESEVDVMENSEMDSDLQRSYLNTLQSQFKDLSKTSAKIRPEIISQVRSIEKLEKLKKLPNVVEQAIKLLENSKSLNNAFGKDVIKSYVKLKNSEIKDFKRKEAFNKKRPITSWERNNTLDC